MPELLTFETKAQAATPKTNLEIVTGSSDASLMPSQAVFSGLTQLLTVLMDKGIVSREETVQWFRNFLTTKTANR
jgi:hypothetical protein